MTRADQNNRAKRLVIILGTMFVVALVCARTGIFSYLQNSHYTICPFYNLFHRPCPSCGMTIGILHTMRFEFHEAMLQNPLSPFVLFGSILVFLRACLALITNTAPFSPKAVTILAFMSSAVVVILWIIRFMPTL